MIVGYMHQVRSYGRSFSSTYHFAPQPFKIDFSDCAQTNLEGFLPLNHANFLWTYANGELVRLKKNHFELFNMNLNYFAASKLSS